MKWGAFKLPSLALPSLMKLPKLPWGAFKLPSLALPSLMWLPTIPVSTSVAMDVLFALAQYALLYLLGALLGALFLGRIKTWTGRVWAASFALHTAPLVLLVTEKWLSSPASVATAWRGSLAAVALNLGVALPLHALASLVGAVVRVRPSLRWALAVLVEAGLLAGYWVGGWARSLEGVLLVLGAW